MLQSSSERTRLAASHKVAGSTSKVGKRVVADLLQKGGPQSAFILAQLFGSFWAERGVASQALQNSLLLEAPFGSARLPFIANSAVSPTPV